MNRNLILLGVGALALATVSFGLGVVVTNKPVPSLSDGKQLVASIDGKDFTAEELFEELKKAGGTTSLINSVDIFIANKEVEVTEDMITSAKNQVAMYKSSVTSQGGDWAVQLANWGFKNEKEMEDYFIKEAKSTLVVEKYFKDQLTEKQINDYYKTDIFGEITAKHILIKPEVSETATDAEKTEANKKAKELAVDVIEKIKNGEKWEDLVKEFSDDTGTKDKDGELTFAKGSVVDPFWDASFALKDGEYTLTPVESTFGYHIILKVKQEEKPELKEAEDTIKSALVELEMAKDKAIEKAWVKIREQYNLKIFDNVIKDLYENISKGF
jgi:foldase protein PrsA